MSRRTIAIAAAMVLAAVLLAWWWRSAPASRQAQRGSASPTSADPVADIASRARDGRRVIFIGLDGADWSLLDRYTADGTMPALARLVREGASGTASTLHPPLSPLVWTSMLTGVSPLEHRILDFLRVNPVSHQREPITSDERQVPAIWNMAALPWFGSIPSASLGTRFTA